MPILTYGKLLKEAQKNNVGVNPLSHPEFRTNQLYGKRIHTIYLFCIYILPVCILIYT